MNNKAKTFKKYYKNIKKLKVIYKKKQSTKVIISTLLKNNIIIINNFNNINLNTNIINTSLKITKDINVKNFKEELKFINILKNKVIKRTKSFSYNTDFNNNNNNKVFILNLRVFKYYTLYKDILLNYKPINNKSVIITNKD